MLQALNHPHIVRYRDSFVACDVLEPKLCICMSWESGGDLGSLITRHRRVSLPFVEAEILKMCAQVASALAYCHHSLKLLHRDLKPANIFISATGDYKLGDFGISRFLATSGALANTQCGTPLYMSPEMARGQSYSRAADVWALGCMVYEMMSLTAPWIGQLGHQAAAGGVAGLMRHIAQDALKAAGCGKTSRAGHARCCVRSSPANRCFALRS